MQPAIEGSAGTVPGHCDKEGCLAEGLYPQSKVGTGTFKVLPISDVKAEQDMKSQFQALDHKKGGHPPGVGACMYSGRSYTHP